MRLRCIKSWPVYMSLALAGGCLYPVRQQVDTAICELTARPLDTHTPTARAPEPVQQTSASSTHPVPTSLNDSALRRADYVQQETLIQRLPDAVHGSATTQPEDPLAKRLRLPSALPQRPEIPPLSEKATDAEKRAYRAKYFPTLQALLPLPVPQPGPFGHPLTLAELQQLAMSNHPSIRQFAADVQSAEGQARQAGAYPNPIIGYEADNVGSGSTAGFQGFFIEQVIKTGGKLKTAQASALMSVLNARLALTRAESDVTTHVRTNYFAFLVAERSLRLNEALAEFIERIYGVFVDQALGGQVGAYEPLQLLAFTNQARASVVAARSRYLSAWRQLVASVGLDERMPLTEVAGHAEMPAPAFNHDEVLERVLKNHTDIQTARNTLQRARYDLHSAEITPIPDLAVRLAPQKDYTTAPFNIAYNFSVGVPIPLWDQNRGAIRQAQGALLRATEEEHRARNALMISVEDAYERYVTNKTQVEYYRDRILPNLGFVYRKALERQTGAAQSRDLSVAEV